MGVLKNMIFLLLPCFATFVVPPIPLKSTRKSIIVHDKKTHIEEKNITIPEKKFDPIVSIAGFMGYHPYQKWMGFQAFILSILIGWCIIDVINMWLHIGYIYDYFDNQDLFP